MEIDRKQIMATFLSILDNISDKDYQKRIWIRGEGPECQDFDEAVNDFFAEGDHILEDYQEYRLSPIQYKLLKKFRDEFDAFQKSNNFPHEFIDSPEWARIMDLAKDVLKAFDLSTAKNDIPIDASTKLADFMLTDKDRRQILNSVLETIEGISKKEYQKRVWILGEGPEVDDFDETCRNFFGEGDPILQNYKEFGLTESQYLILKKFRDSLRVFSNKNYWPPEFIDTMEWARIMDLAKDVLKAFNFQKNK